MADIVDRTAWALPGTHQEAAGVFRIPLPLPNDALHAVNVYAITDGDEVVMVDGGWALDGSVGLLADGLARIEYGLDQVREFLVTHVHRDHYTNAVAVRREQGTPVALGAGEQASLRVIRELTENPAVPQLVEAGAPELARAVARAVGDGDRPDLTLWADPDRWLADGMEITLQTRTLKVIATPGHTRGHVVFYDAAAQTLFAGDHVLPHITPSIGLEPLPAASPLRDYLTSLRLIKALPDARLLPAHGPAAESTHARVDELLAHHEQRLTEMAEAVAAGASTGFEVAGAVGWTRRQRRLSELDLFNQMMAVHETMAHLEVLAERGWLTRSTVDGVRHFARA